MIRRTCRTVALLAAALCFSPGFLPAGVSRAGAVDAQTTKASVPDPARFADEIRQFAEWDRKNAWPADAVLFVGSSSIRMWPTRESFPAWPVINRGFGGSCISDVNHYFKQVVEPYRAKVIVFYAGDNDIAAGLSPEQVRDEFAAFAKRVRTGQPATPIVFLSIKPSSDRWQFWPQMQAANALIRALAEDEAKRKADSAGPLVYVDVASPLLGADGKPRAELYRDDKLHLSPEGYEVWTRTLTPVLERLMKR